ncbi:MAG: hypothetical protein IIB44_12320 [Candidatus Marinimicrobia bacterium]|nr:hypothetical protein [Candidatus Neomarinimicrobiota bacterium]
MNIFNKWTLHTKLTQWFLISILTTFIFACEKPTETVSRELTIWNKYVSNGYDNYEDEIEVNLRLESQGWLWYYKPGERSRIYANSSMRWRFEFPAEFDSLYVHARFFYTKDIVVQIVAADTTIKMDSDKTLMFWNCGDTTVTEYPFPACLIEIDTLTN